MERKYEWSFKLKGDERSRSGQASEREKETLWWLFYVSGMTREYNAQMEREMDQEEEEECLLRQLQSQKYALCPLRRPVGGDGRR